jgi:hypothetical protein
VALSCPSEADSRTVAWRLVGPLIHSANGSRRECGVRSGSHAEPDLSETAGGRSDHERRPSLGMADWNTGCVVRAGRGAVRSSARSRPRRIRCASLSGGIAESAQQRFAGHGGQGCRQSATAGAFVPAVHPVAKGTTENSAYESVAPAALRMMDAGPERTVQRLKSAFNASTDAGLTRR